MAYVAKYSIQFKDFSNTTRIIYITEDGWTGGITSLTPGDNPIVWDEDNSESLTKRVRGITGRIEVIENEYGDLSALFPSTPLQYRVTCEGVFIGYIKAENSTNAWEAGPRVLKFNILSPLAISYDMPMPLNTTMGLREMGSVMFDLLNTFGYSYVTMPQGINDLGDFFRGQVRGMHICPFANDKDYHYANDDEIFAPISCGQFLEEICKRHDLIVHDSIDHHDLSMVFSRFNDTGGMYQWTVANIESGNYDVAAMLSVDYERDLLTDFAISGDNNSESLVKPYSYIDITHAGAKSESVQMPTMHSDYVPSSDQYNLTPRGIWLDYKNVNFKLGLHEAIVNDKIDCRDTLYYDLYPYTIITGTKLLSITFHELDKGAQYRLKFKYSHNSDGSNDALNISARGKGGWYSGNNVSGPYGNPNLSTETFILQSIGGDSGHITSPRTEYTKEYGLYMIVDEYITINFYVATNGENLSNFYLREVELERLEENEDSNRAVRWGEQRFVKRIMGSEGTKPLEIEQELNDSFFSNWYQTDYAFSREFTYLLHSQRRIQVYVRGGSLNKMWYLHDYIIAGEDGWRVVAISYNVRDSIYKLTLYKLDLTA